MENLTFNYIRDLTSPMSLKLLNDNFENLRLKLFGDIKGTDIRSNTIATQNIKDLAIDEAKIAHAAIKSVHIDEAQILSAHIGTAQITDAHISSLAADRIKADKIDVIDLTANNAFITNLNASTAFIDSLSSKLITTKDFITENSVINGSQIANASITSAQIVDLNASKINAGTLSVDRLEIRGATTSLVYAINNISGALQSQNVDTLNGEVLTPRTIAADKIVANSITGNEIKSNSISTNHLVAGSITAASGIIADAAITSAKIANASISSAHIVSLTADKIVGGTLQGVRIQQLGTDQWGNQVVYADLTTNANGGIITITDSDGYLNASIGSESGTGINRGGTIMLYDRNPTKSRVQIGILSSNGGGIMQVSNSSGTITNKMDANGAYINGRVSITGTDGLLNLQTNGNMGMEMRSNDGGVQYIDFSSNSSTDYHMRVSSNYNNIDVSGGTMHIGGAFYASSKSALTMTPTYGEVITYCDESPNHVFIDRGYGITNEHGECYVLIDDTFLETVNTYSKDYFVQLTSFIEGEVKIKELEQYYFVVKGTPNTRFIWKIEAERIGYEKLRFNDADIQI